MRSVCTLLFALSLLLVPHGLSFAQGLYYVATNGDDTGPGTEASPFKSIQEAIDRIYALGQGAWDGWTVWVAGGDYDYDGPLIYMPPIRITDDDEGVAEAVSTTSLLDLEAGFDEEVHVGLALKITPVGSTPFFAEIASVSEAANLAFFKQPISITPAAGVAYEIFHYESGPDIKILASGAGGSPIFHGTLPGPTNNLAAILLNGGQTSNTIIDGLEIEGWETTSSGAVSLQGYEIGYTAGNQGRFIDVGSSPIVRNCAFRDNVQFGQAGFYAGAAMIIGLRCNPRIENCLFENNTETNTYGGAIWIYGDFLQFTGSGVPAIDYPDPTIIGCTFKNNSASDAESKGGAIYLNNARSSLLNCTFENNSSITWGGAIAADFCDGLVIDGCTFKNNSTNTADLLPATTDDSWGGAIQAKDSGLQIMNCVFENNGQLTGTSPPQRGGAVFLENCTGEISSCEFDGNVATQFGGGVALENSAVTVQTSQFIGNWAVDPWLARLTWGGGLYAAVAPGNETIRVLYCDFDLNKAVRGGGVSFLDAVAGTAGTTNATVSHCVFDGNSAESTVGAAAGGAVSGESVQDMDVCLTNCLLINNTVLGGIDDAALCTTWFTTEAASASCAVKLVNVTSADNDYRTMSACEFEDGSGGSSVVITIENSISWDNGIQANQVWDESCGSGDAELYVSFSTLSSPFSGPGNMVANPLFMPGQYRPSGASPCLNSASNAAWLTVLSEDSEIDDADLDSETRILGSSIDMGCYEY